MMEMLAANPTPDRIWNNFNDMEMETGTNASFPRLSQSTMKSCYKTSDAETSSIGLLQGGPKTATASRAQWQQW